MVGIVVVSHSREIASGTVALAGQMAGPDVRIEGAGGTPDGGLGTDADRVRAAIDSADTGDGVIVQRLRLNAPRFGQRRLRVKHIQLRRRPGYGPRVGESQRFFRRLLHFFLRTQNFLCLDER